jgi:N-acetylglucosaminyldiphosphoundecaprenol N-acetyl-beta-D-mannosaminyltransferase
MSGDLGVADATMVELFGVRFVPWTEHQVVEHVIESLHQPDPKHGGWIVTPNVDILRKLVHDPSAREVVGKMTMAVADGMPLVWASMLQHTPLPERVTGASLLESLCEAAARADCRVYLLGGESGVAETAAARMAELYPGLRIDGWSPPFGLESTRAGLAEMRARIARSGAEIVCCGFGFPKQERVIGELVDAFPDVWFLGCGASLTFAAGRIRRAPLWMQRCGLEWVHRLAKEPRRLFRRYVVEDVPCARRLLATSAVRARRRRPAASHGRFRPPLIPST